jgi:hypothetical protein
LGDHGAGAGFGGMGGSMWNSTGGGMYYGSVLSPTAGDGTDPTNWGSAARWGEISTANPKDTYVYGGGNIHLECTGTATVYGMYSDIHRCLQAIKYNNICLKTRF